MRRHTLIGERILLAAPSLAPVGRARALQPRGASTAPATPTRLRGEAIPLGSSIIAVCDAYDAMISERAYRPGMTAEEALAELDRCAGTQFDPAVVEAFCESSATASPRPS